MADKELSYRLVIRDDGTPVLRKVAIEAEKTGAAVTSAQAKAAATTVKPPQFPMSAQMKANADFWMGPAAKAQEESMKKVTGLIKEQAHEASSLERTMERIQRTVAAFVGVWVFQKIVSGFTQMVGLGIEYNATLEQSKLGMAAILTAQGQFADSSGNALKGTEALNAAMVMSSEITKQLQMDNLKTAATYQQLVKAYQQTLAPGLAVGFDPSQIRQYTLAMVQAASAMGLNLDMLAEETRSMLRGAITPRNTLIATALGLRNEDIRKYKNDAEGLYTFIMGKLSAFGEAGDLSQKTWAGVTSNVKDAISMVLGESFKPMFEYLKSEMTNIQGNLVSWTKEGPKLNEDIVSDFRTVNDLLVNILKLSKEVVAAFSPLQSVLSPIASIFNFIMEKLTGMLGVYYEYKKITEDLLSKIGKKIKIDFVGKPVGKGIGGSEDMPFGDMSYNLKYEANKIAPGKEEAEIAEKIAKINLQIATQNKNYKEQIYLVDILTKAEIAKAASEGKSSVDLENALERQGEQRKKHLLIQQEMEKLGWGGEVTNIKSQMAEMAGDIETQIKLEREILNLNIERERAGLGIRDALQREVETAKKLKFEIDAVRKIELDRLNYESKINTIMGSISQSTGDYQSQAKLAMEEYQIKMNTLAATGKISSLRLNEISQLEGALALYKKSETLINGEYDLIKRKLDLENSIAEIGGDTERSFSIQLNMVKEQVAQMEKLLDAKKKLAGEGGIDPKIRKDMEKLIALTKLLGIADINRKTLEFWYKQNQEALQFQATIAELSGDWNSSKIVEQELLQLELDRVLALGDLSDSAAIYATEVARLKIVESEAYRTLNQAQLYEIGMKQFAFKLNQDLADQYANKIPNAINLSVDAFGTFLESIGSGTKTIEESFRSLFSDIGKGILKLLIDLQMAELKLAIMKSLGFGGGASLISMGASLLSPGTSGTTLPGKAGGGPVFAGNAYWVGERGPEIFSPKTSGSIIPNSAISGSQNVKIQIVNESGAPIQAKSSKVDIKPDEYIISVVIDAANRNRMGLRDVFSGG